MKLIDADALRREIQQITFHGNGGILTVMAINKAPVIDAEPVRHGKWKQWDEDDYGDTYECTSCGEAFVMLEGSPIENGYHYCPYCGAKMDARKKNDKAD